MRCLNMKKTLCSMGLVLIMVSLSAQAFAAEPIVIYQQEQQHSEVWYFRQWINGYWNQSVWDFPACDVWNSTAINETTGLIQPECIEYRHLNGSVVLVLSGVSVIVFVFWFLNGLFPKKEPRRIKKHVYQPQPRRYRR